MPQQRPPRPVQASPFNRNPGQALIDRALLPPAAPPIASPLGRSLQPVAPVFPQTQPRFAQPVEAPLLPVAPQRVANPAQVGEPIDYAALAVGSQAEGEKGKNELPAVEGRTIHRDADTYTIFTDDNGKPEENSYFRFDKATGAITDISADVRRELSIPADARRFLAAAFLPFADADAREGSYRPAALEMPVAMINDIGSLLPDNPRSLINAEFMTPLREYAQGASDRTAAAARLNNENLGLGAPDNLYEVALDVAGSLAIPVKGLPRLPGTNAAGNLGRAARAGQVVSDVAFEALTPFRQTGIVPALSVGLPLGVGLTEAQDTLANTNYEGIGDALERATAPDPNPLDALPSDIRTMFDEGDDETKSAIIDLLAQGLGEGHLEIPPNETPDWRNAGAILAGAGASMLGLYSLTSRLKSLQLPANAATTPPPAAAPSIAPGLFAQANPTFVPQPPQIVGRAPVLNSTSLSSRLIGGVAQGDQVLRDRIRARGGSEDLVNRLTRQTPQASSGIIGHSLVTGEFPNSAIPRMPLAPTLEAMSKDLTTGEWDALADGLAAKSALDDFGNAGAVSASTPVIPGTAAVTSAAAPQSITTPQSVTAEQIAPTGPRVREDYIDPEIDTALADYRNNADDILTLAGDRGLQQGNPDYKNLADRIVAKMDVMRGQGFQFTIAPRNSATAHGSVTFTPQIGSLDIKLGDKSAVAPGVNAETALHEGIHAVTMAAVYEAKNNPLSINRALYDETEALRVRIRDTFFGGFDDPSNPSLQKALQDFYNENGKPFGLDNVDELIAWGMTNGNFQQLLSQIPAGNNRTLLQEFVDLIRRFVGLAVEDTSALTAVIKAGDAWLNVDTRPGTPKGLKDAQKLAAAIGEDTNFSQAVTSQQQVQTSLGGKSIPEIQAIADAMDNNPRLSKYASIIQKHYEEALDYARENGYLSDDMFNEMRTARPNYVPLGKNSEAAQTGDTLLGRPRVSPLTRSTMDELMTRNMEELQGTPAGEVADPVRQLPLYVANIIRQVEQNNMRRDIIDLELSNPTVDGAVKRIANGASAANDANVVSIRRNGLVENYIVEDKALFNAMQFNNHIARNIAIDIIALPNRIVQASLTGALQPFFAGIASPMFDVTGGALLRPKGYDLGLISEVANKVIPPLDDWLLPGRKGGLIKETVRTAGDRLKALDPTQLIAPATGALRGGWDEFIGGLANGASEQIIRQDGILYRALGPQGIQRFRDTMALWYKKSITAQMDRAGAGTSGLMNVEEGVNAPSVLNDAAPTFAERASRRAMEDAIAGDPTTIKTLIQGGNGFIRRVGLTPLVRTYMGVMRLLGEGTRYQAFATNAPRAARSVEDAQMVGNQTRRLAGDMREHGSSDAVEQGKKLFMYANPAVQGLAQVGRQFFKDQPLTSLANLTGLTAGFVAIQYYSANDEETQDYIRSLTPEQQASRVVLAPNVFIPVEPNYRPLWGPLALTLNDISGLNEGNYDFNFANAINQMIDGDYSLSEQAELNVREGFQKPLMALNPLSGGNQVVNAAGAAVGADIPMSKYSGQAAEIKSQEVSGFGGEGQLANDPLSARFMAVTEELLSANVTNFLRAAFDVYRAVDNDVGAEEALQIGASRMMDQTVRKSGAVRGLLFGDYVAERSANTQNRALYFEKTKRIAEIVNIFDVDYRNQARTSQQPTAEPRPNEAERVELEGTAMVPIMNITRQLQNQTEDARGRINSLNEAIQDVKNQTRTTIEERNAAVNEYRDEIEELTSQMLEQIQAREGLIRQIIGDPSFTYQSFDPEKYRNMPWAPAPQEMELQ